MARHILSKSYHGSIFILRPMTDVGVEWILNNVQEDAQWFGRGIVVEHRYVEDIINGAKNDGLSVDFP